ncbi:MAG: nucleotide exchange factor GrpE [Flavobacteriaceae bacterium]|nr:nucleotide exchange factor GrpE [Flavobacteriaceae bacterium]
MNSKENINKEIDKDFQDKENQNETIENQEETVEEEVIESETDKLQGEIDKEKNNFLRLFAEFENYKKRTSKERIELFSTANKELMTVMLPILDDFERGLSEVEKSSDKALIKGMQLIYNKFKNSLNQKGLKELEVKQGDVFDAEIHEAITQIPAPSKKLKGKIIDVIEKGYKLGETIIRFPKVVLGN